MALKDWILLLIPILLNGVLLFCFQFFIKRYFDKKDSSKSDRIQSLSRIVSLLDDFQKPIYMVIHKSNMIEFETEFNRAAILIHEIKRYYDNYQAIVLTQKDKYENLFENWENVTNILSQTITLNGGVLSAENNLSCSNYLKEVYEITAFLINEYTKETFQ